MSWADIAIVTVIALSTIFSIFRGFVKETFSLVVWVVAFWVAIKFSPMVSSWFSGFIETHSLQVTSAFITLFIIALSLGGIANHLLVQLVRKTGLGTTDRLLGVLFGLLRGGVITIFILFILSYSPFTEDHWWKESRFIPYFDNVLDSLREIVAGEEKAMSEEEK